MKRWLSLLRWKNLLMVAVTQSVVWWALPAGNPAFVGRLLLVCSTVCITAGGYLINDWHDVEMDAINKPQKAFLQEALQKKSARTVWLFLNIFGLLLAIPPAISAGLPALLLLQTGTILLLWWYAAMGKRLPVIGNVLVALLTALSIELPQFYIGNYSLAAIDLLAGFALFLTWMRELVKDLQDEAGDRAGGCKTLPILAGRGASLVLASVLGGLVLGTSLVIAVALTFVSYTYWGLVIGLLLLLTVVAPLFVWMRRLWRSSVPAAYARSSSLLKTIMGAGLLSFILFLFAFSPSSNSQLHAPAPARFPKSAP